MADKEQASFWDSISYTVTITNNGLGDAQYASAVDEFSGVADDASIQEDSIGATSGNTILDGTTIKWTGALAAGEEAVITYTVDVNREGDRSADNTVAVPATFDDVTEGLTASTSTPIFVPPVTGVTERNSTAPILPLTPPQQSNQSAHHVFRYP